jgi:hypothetical protein
VQTWKWVEQLERHAINIQRMWRGVLIRCVFQAAAQTTANPQTRQSRR